MKLMNLCRERRKCGNVLPLKKIKIDIFWSYNIDLEGKKNKAGFFFFSFCSWHFCFQEVCGGHQVFIEKL